jgi:hypothetical protein
LTKILLINPNPRCLPAAGVVISSVPLGLLYIVAALKQAGYDHIDLIDARARNLNHGKILARFKNVSPDLVGTSAMNTEVLASHELAGLVKETAARSKVVVDALDKGLVLSDINGLAFKKNAVPVINPLRVEIEDIDLRNTAYYHYHKFFINLSAVTDT